MDWLTRMQQMQGRPNPSGGVGPTPVPGRGGYGAPTARSLDQSQPKSIKIEFGSGDARATPQSTPRHNRGQSGTNHIDPTLMRRIRLALDLDKYSVR